MSVLTVPVCVLQYELATGRFPYPKWNSVFDQLTQVVKGEPPQLSNSEERQFSPKFINFVNLWWALLHFKTSFNLSVWAESSFSVQPYKGWIKKAKVQGASGKFSDCSSDLTWFYWITFQLLICPPLPQKHPFILMYEERFVDVASYVCRILDQIPASPISPMYVDWLSKAGGCGGGVGVTLHAVGGTLSFVMRRLTS